MTTVGLQRKSDGERLHDVEEELRSLREWRETIEESIAVQREMVEVGRDIAGAIRVLGWIGKAIKWLAAVGAALGITYASTKGFSK